MPKLEEEKNNDNSSKIHFSLRLFISTLFVINGVICAITAVNFLSVRTHFPSWFRPIFLSAVAVLLFMLVFYLIELQRKKSITGTKNNGYTMLIWGLLIISVICTSALHKFFPFRLDVFDYWQKIPPRHNILRYNYILTAASLVSVIVLAVLYKIKQERLAIIGLVILAAIILIPTCNCGNEFNRIWIGWIGASPLMFMPNSIVILIGSCALLGIWPKLSIINMIIINSCVLALGIGHLTGTIW